jgi:hypothetical protein
MKARKEFLELAERCGAQISGKPDGSEAMHVIFTPTAWRAFDAATQPAAPVQVDALTDERAAFEADTLELFPVATFGRFPTSGRYNIDWIENQWVGWQRRRPYARERSMMMQMQVAQQCMSAEIADLRAAYLSPVQAQGVALSEREQFEAWIIKTTPQQHPLEELTENDKAYLVARNTKGENNGGVVGEYRLIGMSKRWQAWQARAALAQAPQSDDADKQRLDWLEGMAVNVRENLRYGSKDLFWATPADDDGDTLPSDIRKQIDASRAIAALTGSGA